MRSFISETRRCVFTVILTIITVSLFGQTGTTQSQPPSNFNEPTAGKSSNPYLISNLANLRWMSEHPEDWFIEDPTQNYIDDIYRVYFIQTADIDATETIEWNEGLGFLPIGQYYRNGSWSILGYFCGQYEGNNHTITGLSLNRGDVMVIGMFAMSINSTFKNINISSSHYQVTVSGSVVYRRIGGLAGAVARGSIIQNCTYSGIMNVNGLNLIHTGGLAGVMAESVMENSSSDGSITVNGTSGLGGGGLVGMTNSGCTILDSFSSVSISLFGTGMVFGGGVSGSVHESYVMNCYSTGDVDLTIGSVSGSGGLIGQLTSSLVENCYSTGNVSIIGDGLDCAGSIIGQMGESAVIQNSYSTGDVFGGIVGGVSGWLQQGSTITNCYFIGDLTTVQLVGGIAGWMRDSSTIRDSYTVGSINALRSDNLCSPTSFTLCSETFFTYFF